MLDLFLEFYVRAFAVLLPAMAVAIAAFHAVHAGLPRARVVGAPLVLAGLFALWYAGASLMAETGLLMPPPLLDPPYVLMLLRPPSTTASSTPTPSAPTCSVFSTTTSLM